MIFTWSFSHALITCRGTMVAENETRIEAHAGDNFQYVPPNISPNAPTTHSSQNIWDDRGGGGGGVHK